MGQDSSEPLAAPPECSRERTASRLRSMTSTPPRPEHEVLTRQARRGVVRGHVVGAVEVLRSRLADPWTLNSLADEVHLSRSQLVRSFDATVGTSPMAYLRLMRAEQMARLLVSTDLSVGDAARSVGWRNQFHASQCFHAHYGISPTEYRRRQPAPSV
jgi:transcriptional regulator GlxA family with amidase domain